VSEETKTAETVARLANRPGRAAQLDLTAAEGSELSRQGACHA
jgi:hypothetical protein